MPCLEETLMALKHYKIKKIIVNKIRDWGMVGSRCVICGDVRGS